jgi:hypothetical protein
MAEIHQGLDITFARSLSKIYALYGVNIKVRFIYYYLRLNKNVDI